MCNDTDFSAATVGSARASNRFIGRRGRRGVSVLTIDASGAGRTTTTDEQGKYIFPALPPGRYTLRINAPGFSLYENASVEISGAHSESFNVVLSVAGAAEEVTIDLQIRFNF